MTTPSVAQLQDAHSRTANMFTTVYQNPAFDPRQYSTHPDYANVQQGILIRTSSTGTGVSTSAFQANDTGGTATTSSTAVKATGVIDSVKVRFLYNPSDFTENLAPTDTVTATVDPNDNSTNDVSTLIGQTQTTYSFNLLFDRTYEVNAGFDTPGDPSQNSHLTGVMVDILAFKALLGIPLNGAGMPLYLPTYLFLGGVNSPAFYGVITNASIAYSHFSYNMVPMRAAVSIAMTQWLDNTSATSGSSLLSPLQAQAMSDLSTPRMGTIPHRSGVQQ